VQGINRRANNNAKLVTVYVAKSDITKGTAGETAVSSKAIDTAQIPQQIRPATAITTTDQLDKKVALFDIPKNSVIITGMFVDPATAQISFRDRITRRTWVAVSIQVDPVHGVGGFLVAGDEVNMTVDVKCKAQGGTCDNLNSSTPGQVSLQTVPWYLYQKVFILAVGSQPALQPGETASTTQASGGGLLTLEVPPAAVPWIEIGAESGTLYLSLVTKDYVPTNVPIVPFQNAQMPGQTPSQLTPYGPTPNGGPSS